MIYILRVKYRSGWSHIQHCNSRREVLIELEERMEDALANDNNVETWAVTPYLDSTDALAALTRTGEAL